MTKTTAKGIMESIEKADHLQTQGTLETNNVEHIKQDLFVK